MTQQLHRSVPLNHQPVTDVTPKSFSSGFTGLGISDVLLKAIDRLEFTQPTPIQRQAIPIAVEGQDLMGIAQTGTGKTLAFGVPMLQRLAQAKRGRGLIVVPTRELALQVDESLQEVAKAVRIRSAVLIGGEPMGQQRKALEKNPRILVATPGRLIDHLEQRTINLSDVHILVLDEADRMLDMGFAPQIKKIIEAIPKERQTMLFSATMPKAIVGIAERQMKNPVQVEIARSGTAAETVAHEMFFIDQKAKSRLLEVMLERYSGPVLVFTRTKHSARKLAQRVKGMAHSAADISSDRTQVQRRKALEGFKSGKYRVLVATDIAARGIDVTGIELVINYDLPSTSEDYVHRIGRTGRAGRDGRAISFATSAQRKDVEGIEKLIRTRLSVSELPNLPAERHPAPASSERTTSAARPRRSRASRPTVKTTTTRPERPAEKGGFVPRKRVRRR